MALVVSVQDKEVKWIKHYSNCQKILLVGEGDFSFSASLARAFGSAVNMLATSLDSKEELKEKHSTAKANLKDLRKFGCKILHEVNAHTMSQHPFLGRKLFDRIVFNFPHARLISHEHDTEQIQHNQSVVRGFFRNARDMLIERGEIHLTHKKTYPYNKWRIDQLAEEVGLCLVEEVHFTK